MLLSVSKNCIFLSGLYPLLRQSNEGGIYIALHVGLTNSVQFNALEDLRPDYVDLSLSYCGMENCSCGYGFGPQKRTKYVIHIITKGKGFYQVDGKTYSLHANQAFLIVPDVTTYYEADQEDPWSYIWIGFSGIKAYECVSNAGLVAENPVGSYSCTDKLIDYVDQMLAAHQLTYANELKRTSLIMSFMATMIEDYVATTPDHNKYDYPGAVYVKHAVNYLTKNYSKKIKITELAQYIGINRSYLTTSFKKAMKVSPKDFLVNLRMDKAASILRQTNTPINAIAASVGYDDSLAFSKIFKLKYGVSPKLFRETPESLITTTKKGAYQRSQLL